MTGQQWGIRLVGAFEHPDAEHFVPCPDEANAQARAVWWMRYRPDVFAEAVQCDADKVPAPRWTRSPRIPEQRRAQS